MLTKVFIGLTFFGESHFAKKIQSYRARYDDKLPANPSLFMPAVAPFEVPANLLRSLEEEISEEVSSFFDASGDALVQGFTGLDVHSRSRKTLLHLRPDTHTDLDHCAEALRELCVSYAEARGSLVASERGFLTIGRFQDPMSLHAAITIAKKEFEDCSALPAKGICLFVKHNGVWLEQAELHRFAASAANPLYGEQDP